MFEPGSLLKEIGVGPGQPLTKEALGKLHNYWLEVWLIFHIILTDNPETKEILDVIRERLDKANEAIRTLVENYR